MEDLFSSAQVANLTGISLARIRKAAPSLAQRIGSQYAWDLEAIEHLKNRRGKVGRPKNNCTFSG
jgi:hypothetical protein